MLIAISFSILLLFHLDISRMNVIDKKFLTKNSQKKKKKLLLAEPKILKTPVCGTKFGNITLF